MTDQSLYSIRTASPLVLPPEPEDNPAKAKPWFIAPVFDNPHSSNLQDVIRVLMEKTAKAEMAAFNRKYGLRQVHKVSQEGLEAIRDGVRKANGWKGRQSEDRVLSAMSGQMMVSKIAKRAGMSVEGVRDILKRLVDQGRVTCTKVKKYAIWERADAE